MDYPYQNQPVAQLGIPLNVLFYHYLLRSDQRQSFLPPRLEWVVYDML
jgi:hypothetical protein